MKRFVKHFYPANEDAINEYANIKNLTIITIAPMYQNGIFVLFEEDGDNNG